MSILIGFLTIILVLNCAFLILLVLIQLPKKESGLGMAFGGAAADAIFGAGSGNVLTKVTKYSAGLFLGLSLMLSVINAHRADDENRALDLELEKKAAEAGTTTTSSASQTTAPSTTPTLLTATNTVAPEVPVPSAEEATPTSEDLEGVAEPVAESTNPPPVEETKPE